MSGNASREPKFSRAPSPLQNDDRVLGARIRASRLAVANGHIQAAR